MMNLGDLGDLGTNIVVSLEDRFGPRGGTNTLAGADSRGDTGGRRSRISAQRKPSRPGP